MAAPHIPRDRHAASSRHQRERQIAEVLARQGWGYLVGALGLDHLATREHRGDGDESRRAPPAQRLRLVLEELGPTFIKLGQTLSTRGDLLPPEYELELAKLQDAAPRLPAEVVQEVLAAELDAHLERAFASFDLEPLAAASIGQAHAATLRDGTEVVVKVRRPGAVEEVAQDLEILHNLAHRASRYWQAAARYDPVGLSEEFGATLRAELDYLREGRNADRFAANFADDPDVQIPRVFWEATTSRVITLERIYGVKISDLAGLDAAGVDRRELALRSTRVMAKMVFEDGFFHADPHPGNFFIDPTGRIGIIDFGMVGTLDDRLRRQLGTLLIALVREDPDRLATALLGLGTSTGPVDRPRLRDDLAALMTSFLGQPLADLALRTVVGQLLEIVRRHQLRVPSDLALLLKTFIMDEGVAAELDREFRLVPALTPYAYRNVLDQLSPAALAARMGRTGVDLAELLVDFPGQLHRILEQLSAGQLEVRVRADELEPLVARCERLANRIALSVLAAAVIDGVAALVAAGGGRPVAGGRTRIPSVRASVSSLGSYRTRRQTRSRRRPGLRAPK